MLYGKIPSDPLPGEPDRVLPVNLLRPDGDRLRTRCPLSDDHGDISGQPDRDLRPLLHVQVPERVLCARAEPGPGGLADVAVLGDGAGSGRLLPRGVRPVRQQLAAREVLPGGRHHVPALQ